MIYGMAACSLLCRGEVDFVAVWSCGHFEVEINYARFVHVGPSVCMHMDSSYVRSTSDPNDNINLNFKF